MEYEVRFYYSKKEYENIFNKLEKINILKNNGRNYEKTIQYNSTDPLNDFYSKEIDGRFRVRLTKGVINTCKISWKRRLPDTINSNINKEEEIELSIIPDEYNNLINIILNVLKMTEVECYERYRTSFINDEIEIAIDEYPFGIALEIECKSKNNEEEIIDKYVKLLGLNYNDSYILSWDDKYEELCIEQNIEKSNKVLFGNNMPEIK